MTQSLEALIIPLGYATTKLQLPYVIYECDDHRVCLERLTKGDIERSFRLKFIENEETGSYQAVNTNPSDYFGDDNISFFLHSAELQIKVYPKNSSIGDSVKSMVGLAMNCVLGVDDEYAAWQYQDFSTVATKGNYRSYKSSYGASSISENEVQQMRRILEYSPSEDIPEHRFQTLMALMNAATQQAGAADVSCVLYFSILESIYVKSNQELAYKLSMRIAKTRGEDLAFSKKLKKLYDKRSKVIHGTEKGSVFSEQEYQEIEKLAKQSLTDYLGEPRRFSEEQLDSLLLG